jgi:prolipoprotein diacylglyceryltransferase
VGARLWFILFPPQSVLASGRDAAWFLGHLTELNQGAAALWAGGLGLLGAVIGGGLGLWLYLRSQKLPLALWFGLAVLGLAFGQTIGYLGNHDLYGPPSQVGLGVFVSEINRVPPYTDLALYPADVLFHPLWLYESLLSLLVFLVLWGHSRRLDGQAFWALPRYYLLLYGAGRFGLEFLRANPAPALVGLTVGQCFAVIGIVIALWFWPRPKDTATT